MRRCSTRFACRNLPLLLLLLLQLLLAHSARRSTRELLLCLQRWRLLPFPPPAAAHWQWDEERWTLQQ